MGDGCKINSKTNNYKGYLKLDIYNLDHQTFTGSWLRGVVREVVSNGIAVVVLPYDPVRDCVVVTEQFRIGALVAQKDPWVMGFVAGMMGEGEAPEDVARRESVEEIGCEVGRLEKIATFMPSPGTSSELIHVYVGEVDSSHVQPVCGVAEEHEDIRTSVMPSESLENAFHQGAFISAGSTIAVQWLLQNRKHLQKNWLG